MSSRIPLTICHVLQCIGLHNGKYSRFDLQLSDTTEVIRDVRSSNTDSVASWFSLFSFFGLGYLSVICLITVASIITTIKISDFFYQRVCFCLLSVLLGLYTILRLEGAETCRSTDRLADFPKRLKCNE